jgi:RNA polymerase sigma-70 factor (ECF subfamily)
VVNASLDRLRRLRPTVPLPEYDTVTDGRDDIGQRVTQLTVLQALAELPPDQRDAVLAVDLEGYSVEEAAAMLDCPPGTVKSRCSRGRAKLAERLASLRNPDPVDSVVPPKGVEGGT